MAAPVVETPGALFESASLGWPHEFEVPYAASISAGDLLVVVVWPASRTVAELTTTDWTQAINPDASSGNDVDVWHKTATAADAAGTGSHSFVLSGSAPVIARMWRITSHNGIDGSPAQDVGGPGSSTISAPSVTCSAADTLVMHVAGTDTALTEPSAAFSDDSTLDMVDTTSGGKCLVSHGTYGAGATGAKTNSPGGSGYWSAGSLAIAPSGGAPSTYTPLRSRGIPGMTHKPHIGAGW